MQLLFVFYLITKPASNRDSGIVNIHKTVVVETTFPAYTSSFPKILLIMAVAEAEGAAEPTKRVMIIKMYF